MPGIGIRDVPEYKTIFSQVFSPNQDYLAIGDDIGHLNLYSLLDFSTRNSSQNPKPHLSFNIRDENSQTARSPVLAMASTSSHLIIGTAGEIMGWNWASLIKRKAVKDWTISLTVLSGLGTANEINWIEVDETARTAGIIMVASGSNSIDVYDIETRSHLNSFKGHEKYIHCISLCPESGQISSASEDGTVRLWDKRKKSSQTAILKPFEHQDLARPHLGKWIGAVKLSTGWLTCGGGPKASLWHVRSLSTTNSLPEMNDNGIHAINATSDRIFIGGASNRMFQTSYTGELLADIPVSSSCIYSLAVKESDVSFLSCAGSSALVDICSPNLSYKDRTILFST